MQGLKRIFAIAMMAGVMTACGGSGDSSPSVQAATGKVAIVFTDGPADDFDEINLTLASVELLGDGGHETVFTGPETFDIKKLENVADLFALSGDLPAGDYSKIRLHIDDLELVDRDDAGNVIETVHPALPANGKIDLNPRGPFSVARNSLVIVQIDLDANRSIHIVQTGNGSYRFRPVIFVDVLTAPGGRLARVHGDVGEIDETARSFELCATSIVSGESDGDDFAGPDRCITVRVGDDTGLFDATGHPVDLASLMTNDPVTVIGRLRPTDSNAIGALVLAAAVVEIGPPGTFSQVEGVALGAPDASSRFDLERADASVLDVLLQTGTGIFRRSGERLDSTAIVTGAGIRTEGVLVTSDMDPDLLRAALVIVAGPEAAEATMAGTVQTADAGARSLVVSTDAGDLCVSVPVEADIFLIASSGDGAEGAPGTFSDLAGGTEIEAFGVTDVSGCFVADTVLVETGA
ncbi:MAG: DUF4382 domain-containing protein [Gammaproteobacteria bacterium]